MRYYEVDAFRDDNGTWLLTLPAFPEAASTGASRTKAFDNLTRGLQVAIGTRITDNARIDAPLDGEPLDNFVEVPPLTLIKLALHVGMRKNGVSRAILAQKLDVPEERIERLLRVEHNSQLDMLNAALAAIGIKMQVTFEGGLV